MRWQKKYVQLASKYSRCLLYYSYMEHQESIQHTKDIFERLCRHIPPLVPETLQEDLSNALEQVQDNLSLPLDELEQTIIVFGKKLWPYREAFLEFYRVNESHVGEKFLLAKMTPAMKKTYALFKASGGDFQHVHKGGDVLHLFSAEERSILCELFVDLHHDIWDFTKQEVLTKHKDQYIKKINEFHTILANIEEQLTDLRTMADKEQEHPTLAAEIRSHVRGFEQGLSILGPPLDYESLCNAPEYFTERKQYKVLHRHKQ